MDLSPLTNTTLTLASAVFAACVPVVVMKVNAMFKLNLDQTHQAAVSNAVQTAFGIGLQAVATGGIASLANPATRTATVDTMVNYVKQAVPEAISHLNLSDAAIADQVSAHLATVLRVTGAAATAPAAPATVPAPTIALAPAAS
ncbi:hypothetical protein [Acidisoma sp. C75]